MGLNLTKNFSINFSLPKRPKRLIKFIIIHYTGMRNESDAIKRLCDLNSKVSSHYFIKNDGKILYDYSSIQDTHNVYYLDQFSFVIKKS